jgi:hypothetical protein
LGLSIAILKAAYSTGQINCSSYWYWQSSPSSEMAGAMGGALMGKLGKLSLPLDPGFRRSGRFAAAAPPPWAVLRARDARRAFSALDSKLSLTRMPSGACLRRQSFAAVLMEVVRVASSMDPRRRNGSLLPYRLPSKSLSISPNLY